MGIGIPGGIRLQKLKVASSKTRKGNAVQNPHFVDVLRGMSFLELSNIQTHDYGSLTFWKKRELRIRMSKFCKVTQIKCKWSSGPWTLSIQSIVQIHKLYSSPNNIKTVKLSCNPAPSFFNLYLQALFQKGQRKVTLTSCFVVQPDDANHSTFRSGKSISKHVSLRDQQIWHLSLITSL